MDEFGRGSSDAPRLDARARPALLERDVALAAILELLEPSGTSRLGVLAVEGPPGIGKSRLVAAAADLARERAVRPLRARGAELEREFAFGVALQLLEAVVSEASQTKRSELFAGAASLAAPLFEGAVGAPSLDERAYPLLHGLHWLMANLAERDPLVLLIDDLHWSDRPSLRFLAYLAQRLPDLDVRVVVALRPHEAGAHQDLIEELLAHEVTRVVKPAALSEAAAAALVRVWMPAADDEFCRACAEATGGNPFLLQELVASLEGDEVEPSADRAHVIATLAPETVLRTTLVRIGRLPPAARQLSRAVAVLGEDARLHTAAALAKVDLDVASEAADALVAAAILAPGEPLEYAHPLLRSVVYEDIPGAARAAAHRRAADLLAAEGCRDPERLASHLGPARAQGDPWVVDTLASAAEAASARAAPQAAANHLRRALEEPPPIERRPDLLLALSRAEGAVGDPGAVESLKGAIDLTDDSERRAEMLLELGRLEFLFGHMDRAVAALDRGLDEVKGGGSPDLAAQLEAAWITVARTTTALRPAAVARMQPLLERPAEGDGHIERVLMAQLANQLVFEGRERERAIALARRAWAGSKLLEEEGADGMGWIPAAAAMGWADELHEFDEWCTALVDDARRRGTLMGFANVSYGRSYGRYYLGRIVDALADTEAALQARHHGWEQFISAACAHAAWCHVERGDLDRADAVLQIVEETEAPWQDTTAQALMHEAAARIALARGEPAAALELAERAGEVLAEALIPNPAVLPWRVTAALAAAAAGRDERAGELSAEDLRLAREFGAPRAIGMALRVAGLIAGGQDERLDLLEQSVAVLETSPARLELCRSLADMGAELRRRGASERAGKSLRRSLAMAHEAGARAIEQQARDELLMTGARPRRPAESGVHSLTPSEDRVARMAADGMTNRQIAQALFITTKGVQWHLRNVYRKLEIASRNELASVFDGAARLDR